MKRIGMGIVGTGFIGPHHIDAVRRLGYVDVVAIAGSTEAKAQAQADALHVPKGYGDYHALIDDPRVEVVHNATPNYLHYPVTAAAIASGLWARVSSIWPGANSEMAPSSGTPSTSATSHRSRRKGE